MYVDWLSTTVTTRVTALLITVVSNRFVSAVNKHKDKWSLQNCKDHIWEMCILRTEKCLSTPAYFQF